MKKINIILFGIGNVGSTLLKQILEAKTQIEKSQALQLQIPLILNSSTAFYKQEGTENSWEADFKEFGVPYKFQDVINFITKSEFENVIAVDATASEKLVKNYQILIKTGCHIVAANKIANTLSTQFYSKLRQELQVSNKHFLYETNVGAGLPVVETVKSLFEAGEKVTKIRGVFSGSLSYIFNTYSQSSKKFDQVLAEAGEKGYTEPDERIDLSGKDVGRKLLILARELQLQKELIDIKIQDLVPVHLNGSSSLENFRENTKDLNEDFEVLKLELAKEEVLRHIGELNVLTGELEVKVEKIQKNSPLGSLQEADACFEIFTTSYGDRPIVIQGAGAGAAVTARGVLSDLIKLAQKLN